MRNKKTYFSPTLDVDEIFIEQGIAQASNPNVNPSVGDWGIGNGDTQNGEGS